MQPFYDKFESVSLVIGSHKIETVRAQGSEAGAYDHGKAAYEIIVKIIKVFVNHAVMISLIRIIPVGRICLQCKFHRADGTSGNSRRHFVIQVGKIKFAVFLIRHFFHMIIAIVLNTGTIRSGLE